jgi:predicted  nucleic acid-binding Zn-ribbon protein
MKRLVKRILKAIYARTEFLRRPMRKELETLFKGCVASSFDEVRLVMEDLVLELYRLQDEVAALRGEVAELRGKADDNEEDTRSAA